MKGKLISKTMATFLSLVLLQSAGLNVVAHVSAEQSVSRDEVTENTETQIPKEALSLTNLPSSLLSSLEQELHNAISLDEETYFDLYSIGTVNNDGTKSMITFNHPIKYYDSESDCICFINNIITKSDDGEKVKYMSQGNSYQVVFSENIGDGINFAYDQYSMNMKPATDIGDVTASLVGNELQYIDALDSSTDVYYSLENTGIKENIVLDESNERSVYDFVFTGEGLIPKEEKGQSITFINDSTGESIYTIQPIYIEDSYNGKYIEGEEHITYNNWYEVEAQQDGSYLIHMNLDKDFLNAESTVYPCAINSSVWAINFTNDCSSYVLQSGGTGYVNDQLSAGNFNGSGEHLSYIKPNSVDSLKWIEPDRLQSATFNVKAASTGYSNDCTINLYDSMTNSDVSAVTYSELTSSLGTLQSSVTFTTLGASYSFNVTSLFRQWISYALGEGGKDSAYGFILRGATGACTPGRWFSSTSTSDTYFYLVYQEGEEIEDGFYNIRNVSTGTYLRYNSGGQLYLSSSSALNVCKWQIILSKSGDGATTYGTYTIRPYNNLNVSVKGETTGSSVTTNSSGNAFRLIRNNDGTFRIMPAGTNYASVSNAIGISSNYAYIQEYSNVSTMKWTFEPVVNRYYSEYTPDNFNDESGSYPTQKRMNCYGYAFCNMLYYDEYTGVYKQQPGEFASTADKPNVLPNFPSTDPDEIMENIVYNMKLDASRLGYSITEYTPAASTVDQYGANSRLIAIVTGSSDYHFYMQHNDGTWSHKPGSTAVRNYSINSSPSSPVYLTNSNIVSLANQGYYEGGALKFFIITRDAVADHAHGVSNRSTQSTLYYKDIAGDFMFTSTDISSGTTQASFDFYKDYDYYVFTPSSSQTYTVSTTCDSGYDVDGYVYDYNGNQIAYSTSTGQVDMSFSATSGKRYFIKIYNYAQLPCDYAVIVS